MATFKICVRKQRSDGFYPVYIRVTHNRKSSYIKMDKMVDKKGLTRTGGGERSFCRILLFRCNHAICGESEQRGYIAMGCKNPSGISGKSG